MAWPPWPSVFRVKWGCAKNISPSLFGWSEFTDVLIHLYPLNPLNKHKSCQIPKFDGCSRPNYLHLVISGIPKFVGEYAHFIPFLLLQFLFESHVWWLVISWLPYCMRLPNVTVLGWIYGTNCSKPCFSFHQKVDRKVSLHHPSSNANGTSVKFDWFLQLVFHSNVISPWNLGI